MNVTFLYPFRCDNSIIEDRRMEELEIKQSVLILFESLLGEQRRARCQLWWLSCQRQVKGAERTVSTVAVVVVASDDTFRHADGGIAATCRYDAVRFVRESKTM